MFIKTLIYPLKKNWAFGELSNKTNVNDTHGLTILAMTHAVNDQII